MARQRFLKTRLGRILVLLTFTLVSTAVLFELACQAIAVYVYAGFEKTRKDPSHYFQPSSNERLRYELKPNFTLKNQTGELFTNALGFRDQSGEVDKSRSHIILLGDSVTFGTGLTQADTISALVQAKLPTAKVVNAGVPGYGLKEMPPLLDKALAAYNSGPTHVVFLLNLNDFSLRDTVYEGADNGLYRTYHRPWLKSPWFVRKLVYRMVKPTPAANLRWYQWIYRGTKAENFGYLDELATTCKAKNIKLSVVILPVLASYAPDGSYALSKEIAEITAFASARGVVCIDSSAAFKPDPAKTIDDTDHFFNREGTSKMAELVVEQLIKRQAEPSATSGTPASGSAKP